MLLVIFDKINGYVEYRFMAQEDMANEVQFNIVIPESKEVIESAASWRTLNIEDGTPPPLTLEIYLDLTELTKSQSLVILDEQGKRWNVADALYPAMPSNARPYSRRSDRVVLERWQFSLKDESALETTQDGDMLSNIYKKCIPVFRSLVTFIKMMPAHRYHKAVSKKSTSSSTHPALKIRFRILNQTSTASANDSLGCALFPGQSDVVNTYTFGSLETPAGQLRASVTYRTNCDFRVDDSEAMLSSHFMAMDDHYFKPSLGRNDNNQIVGSAPASKKNSLREEEPDQTYGSLSTFHTLGPKPSSSPMSALRAMTDAASNSPSSTPLKSLPIHHMSQESKSSLRSGDAAPGYARRPSVSFQPFKAGSLASSPASAMMVPPLSPNSASGRALGPSSLAHRRGPSLTTLPQAILRTPNLPNETAVASSTSSSPKPAPINRYSSSFSHRRSRFSSGASKGDDGGSSGKPSPSSSAQPGSDVINDGPGDPGSSGSVQKSDDENVKDFLRMLESKKDLKSFSRNDVASQNASMRRTTAALAKYRQMTQSTRDLTDSSLSSLQKGSSTSSSRQLHNVPQMFGASVSTGSSPGKPISPHTHTPAVPSRLSAVNYGEPRRSRSRPRNRDREEEPLSRDEESSETTAGRGETTAIPIPTSPLLWAYGRRASSVNQRQQSHVIEDDDDAGFNIHRSASLPTADERSVDMERFQLQDEIPPLGDADAEQEPVEEDLPPTGVSSRSDNEKDADQPSSEEQLPIYPYRPRAVQRRVYSTTPDPVPFGHSRARGSRGSFGGSVTAGSTQAKRGSPRYGINFSSSSSAQAGTGTAERFAASERGGYGARISPGSRSSTMAPQDDDEDGIFTMSELGGRKSLEEAKGEGSGRRGARGYSSGASAL
jgi:autophagy-related protein 13